ncbi:MAG: ABC transporter permease [Chitinophagaceae bacterium]
MIKNYFTVALRNLLRNKTFTVINITGLAVGIAVFILIFEFVAAEWSSNRFNKNFNNLYRVGTLDKTGEHGYYIPPGFMPLLTAKVADIASFTRVTDDLASGVIGFTDEKTGQLKTLREENICFADSNFLSVFSFPLLSGSPSLAAPKTMALSEKMAKKIFGNSAVTGKTVTISNQFGNTDYTIIAVFKDMAAQSDIRPSLLLSLNTLETAAGRNGNDWADPATLDNGFVNCYAVLKPTASAAAVAKQINGIVHELQPSATEQVILQPFSELHLAPAFNYPYQTFGSLKLVTMLVGVGLLILLIAWVNYINLSTVQALRRARETGVRKVLGASRGQLTLQYLTETFFITFFSVAISFILVQLLQQLFNSFTGRELSLQALSNGWFWTVAFLVILLGSLLSGGYVAFVLSSFSPITAVRGKIASSSNGIVLRKGLVVFQFTISIIFIISTIVMYRQLQYMKTTNLGLNLTQLLVIKGPTIAAAGSAQRNIAFKNELSHLAFIKTLTASNNVPGKGYNFSADHITKPSAQKGDEKKSYKMFIADEHFFNTYGIPLLYGKMFTTADADLGWSKAKKVILNQKAVAALGYEANAQLPGQKIDWAGEQYEIAGIVKDYHHLSLQNAIEPIVFLPSASSYYFTVQTDVNNMPGKIATLNAIYNKYFSGNPFEYFFADETYNKQYASEQQLGNTFIAAAVIAILIACMGLFGLAVFTAQQRTKEIGIRKVMGASIKNIAGLLSLDFVKLVVAAIIIATPVAWWAGNQWLQQFAYRTTVAWWIFAMAGASAILIAVLTVSFQAVKAARANPVTSLRAE